jgi:hypothetical protein
MVGYNLSNTLRYSKWLILNEYIFIYGYFEKHCVFLSYIFSNMAKIDANTTLKRLRNRYRLVVMNEDTYEEVVKFKLSRLSVYIAVCSLFVTLIGLTVALIVFTPLKYYLPGVGYGNSKQLKEYRTLKLRADSIEKALQYKQRYVEDLQKVLQGNVVKMDTTKLVLPKVEIDTK